MRRLLKAKPWERIRPLCVVAMLAGLLAGGPSEAAAPAGSKERLRRLVHLPKLNFQIGVGFDPLRGFAMVSAADAPAEIAELSKTAQESPNNASNHARLAALYREAGELGRAGRSLDRALDLYRRQGVDQSDDGPRLAEYGDALAAAGRMAEAERTLRRGIQVAPRVWRCQAALGRFLSGRALAALLPGGGKSGVTPMAASLLDQVLQARPDQAQVDEARKLSEEALVCLDQAVALDGQEPAAYAGRAVARSAHEFLGAVLNAAGNEETEPGTVLLSMFTPGALADLQKAASLSPEDYRALGTAALFELFAAAAPHGLARLEEFVGDSAWAALPDRTRQSLRGTMARLEELGQGAAKRPAAGASELLGLMQYLFVGDLRGAEASLRRAISLDPNRAQAWDALTLLLATHNRAEDLVTVCEARLKHSDTARHRVLLVKACDQLNQSDRLLEEAEAAQRRYPEDDYVNLTLAAVLMKTSSELGTLNRAGQLLLKAERAATSGATRDQLAHLLYLRGLFLGLVGEKEEARKTFKKLLELDRNHADAQEALQALE